MPIFRRKLKNGAIIEGYLPDQKKGETTALISGLFVPEAEREKGVASSLINLFEEKARRKGAKVIKASIMPIGYNGVDQETAEKNLENFYAKRGFSIEEDTTPADPSGKRLKKISKNLE